jgi:hypothetical protein
MAPPFGNSTGPLYSLGKLIVATPGTSILLSQNVPITTGFGTPTGGVPSLTTSGSPSPMCANQLICRSYPSNVGYTYLVLLGKSGQLGSKNAPNSIVMIFAPGDFFNLAVPNLSNPFVLTALGVDADTANNALQICAVIV